MNKKLKDEVYHTILQHPALSDYKIADKVGVSRGMVWNVRRKLALTLDYQLTRNVAGAFLTEFQMASDYFKIQIERLEDLKQRKKTVQRNNVTTGKVETREVPLDPIDILSIEKQQTDLWKNLLMLARQGEAVEIMKMMRDGRIPKLS